MRIPALIMAGGKGTRMRIAIEKPLLLFLGKPLLDWVVRAVESAEKISEFYVVTSGNALKTERKCLREGLKTIRTEGISYHEDLKQAIREAQIQGPVLTMPADLPAVTGKFLDKVISAYEKCGKDAFAVFVPISMRKALKLSVSSKDEYKGVWYAVSGVNIVDGTRISDKGKIETGAIVTEEVEVLLNINTLNDLAMAERIMRKSKRK